MDNIDSFNWMDNIACLVGSNCRNKTNWIGIELVEKEQGSDTKTDSEDYNRIEFDRGKKIKCLNRNRKYEC